MGFSRQEYGVGSHSLLQGIFPNQGSNWGLLHCRQILYHLRHQGSLQNRLNDIKHVSLVYKYNVSNIYYLGSTLSEARILCLLQSAKLGLTVCSLMDYSYRTPLFMEFSRQEYWSKLPFFTPGDLPKLGVKQASFVSPALAGEFFTICATWDAHLLQKYEQN